MNKIAPGMALMLLILRLFLAISVFPVVATVDTMGDLRVNVLMDYGNETYSWHFGVSLPETATVFDATLAVAVVNYTLWNEDVFVDALNGLWNSHPYYWMWWIWNKTESNWTLGSVACNLYTLSDDDTVAWYYENCSVWPPPPPTVTAAPKLTVSISPINASILMGQSITFTSTASGGYPPYSCQWYLNDVLVSEANASTWTFTPTTSGIYFVHVKVTDAEGNIAQSEPARICVIAVPVGGYSTTIKEQTANPVMQYIALMAILTIAFATIKPKSKRMPNASSFRAWRRQQQPT